VAGGGRREDWIIDVTMDSLPSDSDKVAALKAERVRLEQPLKIFRAILAASLPYLFTES
jgi:hypothetical protein